MHTIIYILLGLKIAIFLFFFGGGIHLWRSGRKKEAYQFAFLACMEIVVILALIKVRMVW